MKILFILLLLLSNIILPQSVTISGRVVDSLKIDPLLNVNILILGTSIGTFSNEDGVYELNNIAKGYIDIQFSYVGYRTKLFHLQVSADTVLTVELTQEAVLFEESLVKGKQASIRETPVAFTNIGSHEIQQNLGARYLTDILQTVPNIFVSEEGGGFADSRLSIRGFDQTSIAVMINGYQLTIQKMAKFIGQTGET